MLNVPPTMKPNPQWRDAPLEEARWTPELLDHIAKEVSRRETDDEIIIRLAIIRQTGIPKEQIAGYEECRFPKRFNAKDYLPC